MFLELSRDNSLVETTELMDNLREILTQVTVVVDRFQPSIHHDLVFIRFELAPNMLRNLVCLFLF